MESTNQTTEKKVEKVTSGQVRVKKKSELEKIGGMFISSDISRIKQFAVMDVIIPTVKKAISEIVKNGIDMILYDSNERPASTNRTRVSYNKCFAGGSSSSSIQQPTRVQNGFDYDNIIFEQRGDADAVLETLRDIIQRYGFASVGDLYDLAEITTNNYTINNYGWTDLRTASVSRVWEGYVIRLPKAYPLK